MLLELGLENFVLITRATLVLSPGLVSVTGETGAGKSLLVQAVKTVLGDRAGPHLVRTGADQAVVQALFDAPDALREVLDGLGINGDDVVTIRRIIPRNGKARAYVNGAFVSIHDLRTIASSLVSIAGQHEYQSLLSTAHHRIALDRFAGLDREVEDFSRGHAELMSLKRELQKLAALRKSWEDRRERLRAEAAEIDAVAPREGEDEALEQERKVLRSASTLMAAGHAVHSALYAEKGSVLERLHACSKDLERMSAIDPRVSGLYEDLVSIILEVEELSRSVHFHVSGLTDDPARLEAVEERITRLKALARKYGPDVSDIIAHRKGLEEKLASLGVEEGREAELKGLIQTREAELLAQATRISRVRLESAAALASEVVREFADLRLSNARFHVQVSAPEDPAPSDLGPHGLDEVRFLFSANVGEPLGPIEDIASGGELSRVMLALKTILSGRMGIETVLFDEIDAGLGGEVAERVGIKLAALARRGQVIVITHFPQIAALADQHLVVSKHVENGATHTAVTQISSDKRTDEIARMLGGAPMPAREYARSLLERAGRQDLSEGS